MGKLIDYNKFGAGVKKQEEVKKYGLKNYFLTFKRKFWKILSLNILFVLYLIPVLALVMTCFNNLVSDKNVLTEYLSEKQFASVYTETADRYCFHFNFDEGKIEDSIKPLNKIYEIVNNRNPGLIISGIGDYDASKFSDNDISQISSLFSEFAETLGFTTEFDSTSVSLFYNENIVFKADFTDGKINIADAIPYSYTKFAASVISFAPLILLAPAICVCLRLMRDYVRGETVFFWHDIADTLKKNWWQSLLIGVIQYVVSAILAVALKMYYTFTEEGLLYVLCFAICLLLAYIFTTAHFYIYLMQVTLNLELKKIYKNAFLFSVIGLFRNFLVIIITGAIVFALFYLYVIGMGQPLVMSLTITFVILLLFGWWLYTLAYIIYPKIQKHVIDPYYAELNAKNEGEEGTEQKEQTDDQPEYIYHNGKMVHRSIYEKEVLFKDDVEE